MSRLSHRILLFLAALILPLAAHAQDAWFSVAQNATTQNLWSVASGNRTLVAVGEQGTLLSFSYDNPGWFPRASGTNAWLVGAGFGAGRFVVVGDRGTILTSDDDGVTWTARTSGTLTRLNAVAYGNGRWLAVGEEGVVLTSLDGNTWTARPALGSGFLRALAFGQGQFLIGGARGALFSTTDATTFSAVPINTTADIESAAITANRFWLVGSNGLWASGTQLGAWTIAPAVATTTFRGVAARSAEEAVAVAETGAVVFRNNAWAAISPAPAFLATAVVQGENEMIAVGFGGGIARADITARPIVTSFGPVEYGSSVRIAFSNFSNTPFIYQWFTRAGALIPGATTPELDVARVTPENNTYRLHFSHPDGTVSGDQNVTVSLYPVGQPEVRDPAFVSALPRLPSLIVPQPDGKLLVAGAFTVTPEGGPTYGLARLNPNGSLDPTFRAGDGLATTASIQSMRVLADGRIYVFGGFSAIGGQARPRLARLLSNGAIDPTFQPAPIPDLDAFSPAVAPDGRLYLQSGYYSTASILRLALDGSVDASFGPLVKHRLIGVDSRGRVLAVDYSGSAPLLVRYLADGTRDSSYRATTVTSWHSASVSEDLESTKITDAGLFSASVLSTAISGSHYRFIKFLPDGGRDTSYQSPPETSWANGPGYGFAFRPDGGLWQIRSNGNGYVARSYTPTGERDFTRYATRPDQRDFQIHAIAPDGSLVGIGNRYPETGNPPLMRIRPITGAPGRLTNLSVRAFVANAADPLITGFVTAGDGAMRALIRGIGPGLTAFGVTDAMRDPRLTLVRDGATITTNDNWDAALRSRFDSVGAFPLAAGSADAALEADITAGNHTALLAPAPGDSGTVLAELYESAASSPAPRRFINISARGPVTAARPLIAGFTITGDVPVQVLIRAAGPALAAAPFNLPGTIADPQLKLYRDETALWENADWAAIGSSNGSVAAGGTQVGAFSFANDSKDAAMLITLSPGSYTAVATGTNGATGTALIEIYEAR